MASQCISESTQSRSRIASPNWLDHGPKVLLQTRSILASQCISNRASSWSPSASLSSLGLSLQVYLSTRSITASKYICNDQQWVYGDRGVMEVDWVTGYAHCKHWEMHHFEAIEVTGQSETAECSQSTFRNTSHDMQTQFKRYIGPRLRSVWWMWEYTSLLGGANQHNYVNPWHFRKSECEPKWGEIKCVFWL
jgi:hypothetical protein